MYIKYEETTSNIKSDVNNYLLNQVKNSLNEKEFEIVSVNAGLLFMPYNLLFILWLISLIFIINTFPVSIYTELIYQ